MALYPINLALSGRNCIIIGGGAVAERKVLDLLAAEASVTIISPTLTMVLTELWEKGRITHLAREYQDGDIADCMIAICATDNPAVNAIAAREARAAGALVNIADEPDGGDFSVPSRISRGNLLITVSTGGRSPAVARLLRRELAERYGEEYGVWLEMVGRMREALKDSCADGKKREEFWRETMETVLPLIKQGKLKEAEEKMRCI